MFIKLYKIRVLFLLASTFILCQCTKAVNSPEPVVVVSKKKIVSPYSLPTASYLAMAGKQEGNQKQNLLLLAAGRLISEGQWRQGSAILAQTNDLTPAQTNEKNLLLAKIDVMRDRPKVALAKLASIHESDSLSVYHQIQFHELLAQSYRAIGNSAESVSERIKLEPLLVDNESQMNNRRTLWLTLINLPEAELETMAGQAANQSELQGWLQLAVISRKHRNNPKSLLIALEQWQSHFSHHPANHILPNPLDSMANKMLAQPKQVALLLPLSGPLSGPGNAIREGFMAGNNKASSATQVKMYDTNKGDVATLYQQAISEGADYVVGPLTKSQVATVAAMNHPVPTLLLNDSEVSAQENSYSFGLSPANEAIQVAVRARNKGYTRALIIAPKNDWGSEVTKVFTNQWQANGGQVVDTFSYGPNEDLNKRMRDFLHITESQTREKQLKQLLGYNLQSSTSRRQDFDMIFLLAYPSKARQIMPLLKYYYAGDVPVYATSSVYGGSANALKDKDLDGIIFCDIPWVFAHQMGSRNWPEQLNSYNRLYALGMDSYALATQLNQLILFPADGSRDTTGTLYLKPSQQVARVLEWGQFRQGLAHSLGETA
ncbi:penicillin-binding protein activator [Legionella maioricensis]|uniref:Penicillin-binding protein activator n=1 Tax=Legionella maioricensis TaxID=2896528 RepID=A0A9X2CZD6_9GAMM|nr:penicillin-binding protein activator [Legionella maioricensis]MCL9683112.1 penicillin-binding protein activator [Legionella maioricensis]MCL9688011.1 penicillin-binding protein activator [Legionella maioricensis]